MWSSPLLLGSGLSPVSFSELLGCGLFLELAAPWPGMGIKLSGLESRQWAFPLLKSWAACPCSFGIPQYIEIHLWDQKWTSFGEALLSFSFTNCHGWEACSSLPGGVS